MSLLKRLGGAPQPNDTPPAAAAPPPPPLPENGVMRSGSMAAPPPPPPEALPRVAPPEPRAAAPQPASGGGLSNMLGISAPSGGDVTMGATDQRVLELSLWIVDRIQGSMGNQTELKRTPESERMLQ